MTETFNKNELVHAIADKADLNLKQANNVLNATLDTIVNAVADGKKVTLIGFGNFEARKRSARKGRNPQTGTELTIPASTVPAFKPGKAFKDAVKL